MRILGMKRSLSRVRRSIISIFWRIPHGEQLLPSSAAYPFSPAVSSLSFWLFGPERVNSSSTNTPGERSTRRISLSSILLGSSFICASSKRINGVRSTGSPSSTPIETMIHTSRRCKLQTHKIFRCAYPLIDVTITFLRWILETLSRRPFSNTMMQIHSIDRLWTRVENLGPPKDLLSEE